MGHILIFNRRPEEREFLFQACRAEGLVYTALDREKALHLLDTVRFSVALVDVGLAGTEGLARALEPVPCLILTGRDEERLSEAVRDWPTESYVDYILVSQRPIDQIRCRKVLATAEEYARLKSDLTSVVQSRDSAERKLKDVAGEIRTLNQALTGGLARELERRSRLEERYASFQKLTVTLNEGGK